MLTSRISEESRNQFFLDFLVIFSIFKSPIIDFPFNPSTMDLSRYHLFFISFTMRNISLLEHKPFDQLSQAGMKVLLSNVKTGGAVFLTMHNPNKPLLGLQTQKADLKAEALKCNSLLVTGYELADALAVF